MRNFLNAEKQHNKKNECYLHLIESCVLLLLPPFFIMLHPLVLEKQLQVSFRGFQCGHKCDNWKHIHWSVKQGIEKFAYWQVILLYIHVYPCIQLILKKRCADSLGSCPQQPTIGQDTWTLMQEPSGVLITVGTMLYNSMRLRLNTY